MPYSSKAQQRFMHAQHPDIAKRWDKETKNFKYLPERIKKKALGGEVGYKKGGGIKAKLKRYEKQEKPKDKESKKEDITEAIRNMPRTMKNSHTSTKAKMAKYMVDGYKPNGQKLATGGGVDGDDTKTTFVPKSSDPKAPSTEGRKYYNYGEGMDVETTTGVRRIKYGRSEVDKEGKITGRIEEVKPEEYQAIQGEEASEKSGAKFKWHNPAPTAKFNKAEGGEIDEEKSEVKMPKKEFMAEHKRLIARLKSGSKKELASEAKEQAEEVSELEDKKDGGEVKGEGTGTSDSIPATIRKGSFIIPANIKHKLKKLLSSKEAKLKQGGGVPVNLSKGEQVLAPSDAKKLNREMKRNGIKQGLNILAPHAKKKYRG